MMITIRPVADADCDAARDLLRQLGYPLTAAAMRDRLAMVAASPIDWLFVAEIAGTVRGLIGIRRRERIEHLVPYAEISVLVTDAAVRRQGVGRALVAFAEQFAREQGCGGMFLVSGFARQDEAHRFYTDLGYATTGYRFVKALE